MKTLSKRQLLSLKKHKKNHTKKHMDFMNEQMIKGKSFTQAHNLAIKKLGK